MQAQTHISVRFAELDFLTRNHVHGPESFDFVKTKFEAAASIKKRKKPDVAAAGQVMRGYLDGSYDDDEDNFVREFRELLSKLNITTSKEYLQNEKRVLVV